MTMYQTRGIILYMRLEHMCSFVLRVLYNYSELAYTRRQEITNDRNLSAFTSVSSLSTTMSYNILGVYAKRYW